MPRYTLKQGDSAGGYWAQILDKGVVIATIYEPELVERLVDFLNGEEYA